MEAYYTEIIEYLVTAIFYGMSFGLIVAFLSPVLNMFDTV